ncbi:DNA-binding transcriptional regulator DsdC [Psychrobacter alimentarius]|uniref:DNA-binding transcriptional regulator DsdC n=1 Tax=Psychrobacter alimentarius TaxID=261164 RepID=UPI001919D9CC|nr:DNA-binding transcriptional regulator DsdC [Psychrobacter alimentarius]
MAHVNTNPASTRMLGNLHCFSCVARHMSFTFAADELCLTQSAVSHRIKQLEAQLGFSLFLRFNRRIQLTYEGEQLWAVLNDSLSSLDMTIRDLRNQDIGGHLTVSAPPSFAQHWITPRLSQFQKQHPRLFLHFKTHSRLIDFSQENIDIAIYYGNGDYPGLHAQRLMTEYLQPVCSPEYAREHDLYDKRENLAQCQFLHDVNAWPDAGAHAEWEYWCEAYGIAAVDLSGGYSFDRSEMAVNAAKHGLGIAMGRLNLIQDDINCGELVAPFKQMIRAKQHYFAVCHPDRVNRPAINALLQWLSKTAAQDKLV